MLTQEYLKSILSYDPETGLFLWKEKKQGRKKNKIAGHQRIDGYVELEINYKRFLAHRLAFYYIYGIFPKEDIDHVNGIKNDNRFLNLRTANRSENMQNVKNHRKDNKSGFLGVSFNKQYGKYVAQLVLNKKHVHISFHDNPENAHEAYIEAKRKLHPFNQI